MPSIWNMLIGQSYNTQDIVYQKTINSCFLILRVLGCTTVDHVDKLKSVGTHYVTHMGKTSIISCFKQRTIDVLLYWECR